MLFAHISVHIFIIFSQNKKKMKKKVFWENRRIQKQFLRRSNWAKERKMRAWFVSTERLGQNRTWISITVDGILSIRQANERTNEREPCKNQSYMEINYNPFDSFAPSLSLPEKRIAQKIPKDHLNLLNFSFRFVFDSEMPETKTSNKQGMCVYKFMQLFGYLFAFSALFERVWCLSR